VPGIQRNTGSLNKISYDFLCHILSSRLLFVEAVAGIQAHYRDGGTFVHNRFMVSSSHRPSRPGWQVR
jgi:hypothetical protein